MSNPLVIAYHLIWTAYGWWLPNDLRGSYSHFVKSHQIAELAPFHYGRRAIQPASRDIRSFYEDASQILQHSLLAMRESERSCIADAFAETVTNEHYTVYACAIMPDHVHILIRKHKHTAEQMIENLKSSSRSRLSFSNFRTKVHPTWSVGAWKVFLDHPDEVWRTIRYIEKNPRGMRLPDQHHPFVKPYDNWPLHNGHSPSSPYVHG